MAVSVKCSEVGGPCDEVIHGADKAELTSNLMTHAEEKHPEIVPGIKAMTPEQNAEWDKTLDEKMVSGDAVTDGGPSTPAEEEEEKEIAMM